MSELPKNRVQALEQAFLHIADTRMRDVPVQNLALRVHAVGFEPHIDQAGKVLLGVLITPWFMNLVRLPFNGLALGGAQLPVGQKAEREVGGETFDFIGAHEEKTGAFEVCSLFSPMFEFSGHAAAVATAHEVLKLLRSPVPNNAAATPAVPSRRGFLLGRGARPSGA